MPGNPTRSTRRRSRRGRARVEGPRYSVPIREPFEAEATSASVPAAAAVMHRVNAMTKIDDDQQQPVTSAFRRSCADVSGGAGFSQLRQEEEIPPVVVNPLRVRDTAGQ